MENKPDGDGESNEDQAKRGFMSEEDYDNFFKFGADFGRDPKRRSGYKFSNFGNDLYSDVTEQ